MWVAAIAPAGDVHCRGRTQDGRFYYNRLEESKGDDSDEDKPRRPRYGMEKVRDQALSPG
jgi:hypothetical protein